MYVMYEFVRACDTSICIVIYALDTCVFVCVFQICYLCMTLWIWSHHTCTWWVESCVSARANAQIYNRGNVQGCGRICVYMHTDTDTATYIHASACIRIGYSNILLYAASTHSHVTSIGRNARKQSRQCMPPMTTYLACRYTCMPSQTQMRRHIDMHANWNASTRTRTWVFVFGQHSCICIHTCSHHTCSHTCMSTCMHARTTVNPMALHGK